MGKIVLEDEYGMRYKYVLCYMHYGWEEEGFSNDLRELDSLAKELQIRNTGKPLIIVDDDDEIIREYSERLWSCRIGAKNKLDIFT